MKEESRTITFTEEEYKIMVAALWELRKEYIDNDIAKSDINDVIEKLMTSPKKKNIFTKIEVR